MSSNIHIFNYLNYSDQLENKDQVVDFLLSQILFKNNINKTILSKHQLKSIIESSIGEGIIPQTNNSTASETILEDSINKLIPILSTHYTLKKELNIYLLPFFPSQSDNSFEGVTGTAVNTSNIFMFVSNNSFSLKAFEETLVHEFNHLMYYDTHHDDWTNFTVFEHCIMEGFAELFREELVGGAPAPWSIALSEQDAVSLVKEIGTKLDDVDEVYRKDLMFGGTRFEKWSGYSLGYWLVHRAKTNNPNLSWEELMSKNRIFYTK